MSRFFLLVPLQSPASSRAQFPVGALRYRPTQNGRAVFFLENPRQKPSQSMYYMGGREQMTHADIQFLKAMGIDPCSLDDPFPSPLPSPPPPEAPIPKLTEEDSRWLQDLGVAWEQEPEPEFVIPPKTLPEYLDRFPTGIRQAVGEVAKEMGLAMPDGGLDDLAQDIVQMFLDFNALGLEDVVELYSFYSALRPGGSGSAHFHDYIRMRMAACVPVVLRNHPTGTDALGESLGS